MKQVSLFLVFRDRIITILCHCAGFVGNEVFQIYSYLSLLYGGANVQLQRSYM